MKDNDPIVRCVPIIKPGNIFSRFAPELNLRLSKARAHARKGELIIVSRPEVGKDTRPAASTINKNAECIFFVFTGEFGYEILSSHGWLRKLKRLQPNITIGVSSRAGVEFLYEGACDIYVEIKDVLSKIMSDCFGLDIGEAKKSEVLARCQAAAAKHGINPTKIRLVYSTSAFGQYGVLWGRHERVASMAYKDHAKFLQQDFAQLKLAKYGAEREELLTAFPALRTERYCVLHDRRRCCSWGHEMMISPAIWLEIIERLKRAGYLVVMIAYTPWKHQDAYSIFSEPKFKGIPGTINLTDFLDKHLDRNLLYQALLLQGADWQLSPWGTAGKLPCLVGKTSYMLTIDRKRFSALQKTANGWNKAFVRCGGNLTALESTTARESILGALEKEKLFQPRPRSLRGKITVLIPTNYVLSCPGTKLLCTVLASLARIPELEGCRVIIGYDMPEQQAEPHKEYLRNLSNIGGKWQIEVIPMVGARQRKAFCTLINACKTPYFLFWEHDWSWLRLPDLPGLVSQMDANASISAVYFSKRANQQGAKMGDTAETLAPANTRPPLLKTNRWSNNPQLTRRAAWDKWMPIVQAAPLQWPGQKPSKQIEPALHLRYLEEIKRDGFDAAHARWGMYVYGRLNDPAMVRHLDGKTFK